MIRGATSFDTFSALKLILYLFTGKAPETIGELQLTICNTDE